MSIPFFSVVIPTHLRPRLLERALRSLRGQRCDDFEAIVVADEGDAATATVAAALLGPADTFVKRPGQPGPAASRNLGLGIARGEWVIFLDDDDTLLPHHLAAVADRIARDVCVLFSDCDVITEDRGRPDAAPSAPQRIELAAMPVDGLWVKNFIPCHALAYRRGVLDGCTFDPHLRSLEDWDFLLAVASRATPEHFRGGGAVMHKDYVNPGARRGGSAGATGIDALLDVLHVYRRWPAPTLELKARRKALLAGAGLDLPVECF